VVCWKAGWRRTSTPTAQVRTRGSSPGVRLRSCAVGTLPGRFRRHRSGPEVEERKLCTHDLYFFRRHSGGQQRPEADRILAEQQQRLLFQRQAQPVGQTEPSQGLEAEGRECFELFGAGLQRSRRQQPCQLSAQRRGDIDEGLLLGGQEGTHHLNFRNFLLRNDAPEGTPIACHL